MLCVSVSIGAWADETISLSDGGTIEIVGNTAYIDTKDAGTLASYKSSITSKLNPFGQETITFVVSSTSQLNLEDLKVFYNEYNTCNYILDLLEISTNIDTQLADLFELYKNNGTGLKGVILPITSDLGTSAVETKNKWGNPTLTQFAAYCRNGILTVYTHDNTQTSLNKALSILTTEHSTAVSAATIYMLSMPGSTELTATIPSNVTEVMITNSDLVNRTTDPVAVIHVTMHAEDDFKNVVEKTNIESTPTEKLILTGPVSSDDLESIASFTNGPRVLDLRNATGLTPAMVAAIAKSSIEYLILPNDWPKADVNTAAKGAGLTGLKAAISVSTDGKDLVGYIKQAGSLAEARVLATGGSEGTVTVGGTTYKTFTPTTTGLDNLTLSGNLNASDLAAQVNQLSAVNVVDGHLYSDAVFSVASVSQSATANGYTTKDGITAGSSALNGESFVSIDLRDAEFANNNDMNFNLLGLLSGDLTSLSLPISSTVTTLPLGTLNGSSGQKIDYLCIPSNITTIGRMALNNTTIRCITTDNANHTQVIGANGEPYANDAAAKAACYDTFTFSSTLQSIGTLAFTPQSGTITDVYVMATTTPACEKDAFSSGMLYGWGGYDGAGAFCRDKYVNGGIKFTMLHFPEQGNMTDAAYKTMKKLYTDVNKKYTKKDQTGAVDANGDPIAWPSQNEIYRTYNQASLGLTWNEWVEQYDPEVNTAGDGSYDAKLVPNVTAEPVIANAEGDYDFSNYIGWHQFVLAMATKFDQPEIIIEDEKTVEQYVEGDWYTLCLPFSLTEDQLIRMLGVPKSEGNVIRRLVDANGDVIDEDVSARLLPDLRTLRSVTRKPGSTNEVTFLMTNNLTETSPGSYQYWSIVETNPATSDYGGNGTVLSTGENNGAKIALRGGYPYYIKPYKRYGETFNNLGKYLMARFASEFENDELSCKNTQDGCVEALNGDSETAKFAKPFERHKIQAFLDVSGEGKGYTTHSNGKKYYYTFVGQFWDQPLPQYSFYLYNNKWYRYSSGTKNYTWEAYKCIIMATQEEDDTAEHPNSGKYRNNDKSVYPEVAGTDAKGAEIFNENLYIEFLKGLDDSIFSGDTYAKYNFVFDDNIIEVGDDSDVTAIRILDGVDVTPIPQNARVYNMAGQYIGSSLDGLDKGIYIVNGKKIVVK